MLLQDLRGQDRLLPVLLMPVIVVLRSLFTCVSMSTVRNYVQNHSIEDPIVVLNSHDVICLSECGRDPLV